MRAASSGRFRHWPRAMSSRPASSSHNRICLSIPATLACQLCGAAIGAAQGYFVAFWRIPSFFVRLAGMLRFKGLCLALLQGQSVWPFSAGFQRLSSGFPAGPPGGES